eukprot:COSAG05_NODE_6821_length_897_cov_1.071429_1_plen_124_part_00
MLWVGLILSALFAFFTIGVLVSHVWLGFVVRELPSFLDLATASTGTERGRQHAPLYSSRCKQPFAPVIRGILMLPQKNLTTNEQINMYRYPHFMDDATGMLVNPCPPFCPALQEGLYRTKKGT